MLGRHGIKRGASRPYANPMVATTSRRRRARGSIESLPSGALRVAVYAGVDPLTGRRHYLREVVPAGPKAAAEADKAPPRLAGQVDEQRHPRTNASAGLPVQGHWLHAACLPERSIIDA